MDKWQIILAASSAIILFLFGIENFSKEIQKVSGEKLRKFLTKHTTNPFKGLLIGGLMTSVIQSSTATSVIAVGLVNAGIITFRSSLGIIFGANIGTTITAQLVAFHLTNIAPYFLIFGFILSIIRIKYSFIGKSVFFFGFVFFSLNIISSTLSPLKEDPALIALLSSMDNYFYSLIAGTIFTAIFQSSSVTTGIAVILTQQGLMTLDSAIPIVIGANVGTTITAILASLSMDLPAKKTAFVHTLYNFAGVLIFTPIFFIAKPWLNSLTMPHAETLANVHFAFNFLTSLFFMIFINPFSRWAESLFKGNNEIEPLNIDFPKIKTEEDVQKGILLMEGLLEKLIVQLKENYFLISLAIEAKEEHLLNKCKKHHRYLLFLRSELEEFCAQVAMNSSDEKNGRDIIELISKIDYIYQINDSIEDLIELNDELIQKKIPLSIDSIVSIREISGNLVKLFDVLIKQNSSKKREEESFKMAQKELHATLAHSYQKLLKIMTLIDNEEATPLARYLSVNQRLKDKMNTLQHL